MAGEDYIEIRKYCFRRFVSLISSNLWSFWVSHSKVFWTPCHEIHNFAIWLIHINAKIFEIAQRCNRNACLKTLNVLGVCMNLVSKMKYPHTLELQAPWQSDETNLRAYFQSFVKIICEISPILSDWLRVCIFQCWIHIDFESQLLRSNIVHQILFGWNNL